MGGLYWPAARSERQALPDPDGFKPHFQKGLELGSGRVASPCLVQE
jgi:hypothetical protein